MQLVQSSSIRFDNMQVKARPNAREVAAVYTVDEISMELVVKLAANHPLGVVSVESGKKIGVTAAQWRSWMLQMTTFLTHQVRVKFQMRIPKTTRDCRAKRVKPRVTKSQLVWFCTSSLLIFACT